jgi:hypothetical protein
MRRDGGGRRGREATRRPPAATRASRSRSAFVALNAAAGERDTERHTTRASERGTRARAAGRRRNGRKSHSLSCLWDGVMAHQTQPVAVPLRGSPSFSDFSLGASSWSQEDSFSLLEQRREAPALGRPGIGAAAPAAASAERCPRTHTSPAHTPLSCPETAVPFPRRLSLPAKLPALFPLGKPR